MVRDNRNESLHHKRRKYKKYKFVVNQSEVLKDESKKGTKGNNLNFSLHMLVKKIGKPIPIITNKRE